MGDFFSKNIPDIATRVLIVVLVAILTFSAYEYGRVFEQNLVLGNKADESVVEIINLKKQLTQVKGESQNLSSTLRLKEETLADISKKADYLEKVRATDAELLKKYSKVFFLNENYLPRDLAAIDTNYLANASSSAQILAGVEVYLRQMIDNARKDGVSLQIVSGYRSFSTQAAVKSGYKFVYGAGTANKFSADQGYSEHQLGTAVDFTTASSTATFAGFEKTAGYKWLTENAHQYGFILSYPVNNSYYQFEPWHWRFVGRNLATRLHDLGIYFYDYDQRDIDAYLGTIFD